MWRRQIGALFLSAGIGLGASCPVELALVQRDTGLGDNLTYCFSFRATNTSGKAIATAVVHAAAVDSRALAHTLQYDYPVDKLAAGAAKDAYFSTHRLIGSDYRGVKLWVESIRFSDGSLWQDNGGRTCGAEDVKAGRKR